MFAPPRPDVPSMAGRTCVVTGANSGIGLEVARGLAAAGARVLLACRSAERGEAARADLVDSTGNADVHVRLVDLTSQASIRRFTSSLLETEPQLHVLVNNAGLWSPERQETEDGLEQTWAVNALAYFLLSNLLLERLQASAPARIINVASEMAGGLDVTDLQLTRRRYTGVRAYKQSKQANRMLTRALARRVAGTGVVVHAIHPGGVNTGIARRARGPLGPLVRLVFKFGRSPARGAAGALWLAAGPEAARSSGDYWFDRRLIDCPFDDPAAEEALWQACEAMTKPR